MSIAVVVIKLFLTVTLLTSLIAGFRHCLLVGQGNGAFRFAPRWPRLPIPQTAHSCLDGHLVRVDRGRSLSFVKFIA
jgi:hypothetical protein